MELLWRSDTAIAKLPETTFVRAVPGVTAPRRLFPPLRFILRRRTRGELGRSFVPRGIYPPNPETNDGARWRLTSSHKIGKYFYKYSRCNNFLEQIKAINTSTDGSYHRHEKSQIKEYSTNKMIYLLNTHK